MNNVLVVPKEIITTSRFFREYFKMRRTSHGKTDWVDVEWKGGVMPHPVQRDGCSCGVIVVEVS
jgi:hypothetical protein